VLLDASNRFRHPVREENESSPHSALSTVTVDNLALIAQQQPLDKQIVLTTSSAKKAKYPPSLLSEIGNLLDTSNQQQVYVLKTLKHPT
jgi:hypothetical protein